MLFPAWPRKVFFNALPNTLSLSHLLLHYTVLVCADCHKNQVELKADYLQEMICSQILTKIYG